MQGAGPLFVLIIVVLILSNAIKIRPCAARGLPLSSPALNGCIG